MDEKEARLRALLIDHEGLRLFPYQDTVGKLTIGIGRNLDDTGIAYHEAMYLLESDIARVKQHANTFPWFRGLDTDRQHVVLSMIFNLGWGNFLKFKKFISALEKKNYVLASQEMLNSAWAKQVPLRVVALSKMMKQDD